MSTINFILFTVILACSSTIVLGAADVSDLTITEFNGGLSTITDSLLGSLTNVALGGDCGTGEVTGLALVSTSGSGSGIKVKITPASANVGSVTVTDPGSGYQIGDILTLSASGDTVGTNKLHANQNVNLVFTLTPDAFIGVTKETKKAGFRDWMGTLKTFTGYEAPSTGALTGYYLPLLKTTRLVQVTSTFASAGTLVPQLGTTSDSTLATTVPSTILFSVADGLSVLKLVSADGTYEINLVKPDDEIKMVQSMKRSIEIAYTPAAVGEFSCSAFTDAAGAPSSRADVKTNGVTKSVRTNNIVQENIFNSVQMTLNGLTPNTIYDIHCFHLSHGIISNIDQSVKTDLASLTGVSLTATTSAGVDPGTLTLTFTHEGLLSGATAVVIVEIFHNYAKAEFTDTSDCKSAQTVQSGGTDVNGAEVCTGLASTNEWKTTFHATGSSSAGSQVVITLTNPGNMIPNNPSVANSILTFHLDVSGHSKLLHQEIESV